MMPHFGHGRRRWSAWRTRQTRLARVVLSLLAAVLVLSLIARGSGFGHSAAFGLAIVLLFLLVPLLLILALRVLRRRLLWKVRNRLIVTYLLLGLAPIVLLVTLTAIAGYMFAGQYATNAAIAMIDQQSSEVNAASTGLALLGLRPAGNFGQPLWVNGSSRPSTTAVALAMLGPNGTLQALPFHAPHKAPIVSPFDGQPIPKWLYPGFHGLIAFDGSIYLCSETKVQQDNHTVLAFGSLPVGHGNLDAMARGLGRVRLSPGFSVVTKDTVDADTDPDVNPETIKKEVNRELATNLPNRGAIDDEVNAALEGQKVAQRVDQRAALQAGQQTEGQIERQAARRAAHRALRDILRPGQNHAGLEAASPVATARMAEADHNAEAGRSADAPDSARSAASVAPASPATSTHPPQSPAPTPAPRPDSSFTPVGGGLLPAPAHFFDYRVLFSAPLPVFSWQSGGQISALISVVSRPALLYERLFATSVTTGKAVRIALLVIAAVFGMIELLALLLAVRLSRTITGSVAALYRGTTEIDRGNLAHRVPVGQADQLGALAASFNSMAGSLDTLLEQQREQQRFLSELAIAQEVQQNLFPHSPVTLSGLELHAVCLPARSVSGDYFDFIYGSGSAGLCIALGDISGKGISAALLMASLHSAVRAFSLGAQAERPAATPAAKASLVATVQTGSLAPPRAAAPPLSAFPPPRPAAGAGASVASSPGAGSFGVPPPPVPLATPDVALPDVALPDLATPDLTTPELATPELPPAAEPEHCVEADAHAGPAPSPARLLELLNQHLYASTPPEKYATLFLAFYDQSSRRLTYSNGGHLPPLILHADGTTRRLDCGGSVVGLLEGMAYLEDTVELGPGDLLFAYSDGLTEPENAMEEEFGEARLLECIREHRAGSLPALAATTLETLQHWIGDREQPDDMTLLLARQH